MPMIVYSMRFSSPFLFCCRSMVSSPRSVSLSAPSYQRGALTGPQVVGTSRLGISLRMILGGTGIFRCSKLHAA
jgi:hypothetical protein